MAKRALNLSFPEAAYLWITGSPPSRLQKTGRENIHDFYDTWNKFTSESDAEEVGDTKDKSSFLEKMFGVKRRPQVVAESQALA